MTFRSVSIVCMLCVLFTSQARAQEQAEASVDLGVLAGANVADQAGRDVFAPHDKFGFIGGVSGVLRFSPRWSLQLDGLYVEKGGRENNDKDPGDPNDDEISLRYLEFPVLVKFAFSSGGTRPELFVGPSFAYELSCTFDTFPEGSSDPVDCADAGLQTRSLDVGVAFGADVEIPLGSGHLVIDGRGIVGLSSFDDSEADLDFRNRILSLMVGYRFAL
ncbi:MAG: PorT family protein [marine benthic group bacterium]|nr:PorT family protein [Candidatus Benthicola marisminoris]